MLGKIGKLARLAADYHDALGNLDCADPLGKPGIQAVVIIEAADHHNGPAGRGRHKAQQALKLDGGASKRKQPRIAGVCGQEPASCTIGHKMPG